MEPNEKKDRSPVENSEIKTRTPVYLRSFSSGKKEMALRLDDLTSENLKKLYKIFFGKTTAKPKAEICDIIAETLSFPTEQKFREWFFTLPALTQKMFFETAFTGYVPIPLLERKWNISLAVRKSNYLYSWSDNWQFNPDYQRDLCLFSIEEYYGCPAVTVPQFLLPVMRPWLVPPPTSELSACRAENVTESWNNSLSIPDSYPLLCDALRGVMEGIDERDSQKILRSGFKKKILNELRSSTGFIPFALGDELAPDSVDLAARFILCMSNCKPMRPGDGQEGIRTLVETFFSNETQYPKHWYMPDRAFLEYTICLDHLSRIQGYSVDNSHKIPVSRKIFHDILLYAARDGGWLDADKLAEHIRIMGKNFAFCEQNHESSLRVKTDAYVIDGISYSSRYEDFHPDGPLRFYLLERPLFKAYCYIFAALGLLEIVQTAPPLVRYNKEKRYPISPYDSLRAIRITELGRWCLGLTGERPPKLSHEYDAIADRELFLVTVHGSSLERQVYLDKIGRRLGESRWRISPASFISGCINKRQIAERVERFKMLIDSNPAPHWEQLFQKVIERAGLFDKNRSDMLVYDLPGNREIAEELIRDPELKHIARRVEGRMLAVAFKDEEKFFALLKEHGIARF